MSQTELTRLLARNTGSMPVYMSPHHAEQVIERIMAVEPSALRSPSRLEAWLRRKGWLGQSKADAETPDQPEAASGERRSPPAYCPAWMGEPDDELAYGTALKDGVAVINVDEALPARGYMFCGQWVHGYDSIDMALREALADERVRGVLLRLDSPGGVVHDNINQLTATMRAAEKPIWAHAEMACSAAYWIAAQADHITAITTGLVGSIGACIIHTEISAMLSGDGVRVTAIESGPHKTGGAHFKALSEDALEHLQAQVDEAADRFIEAVVTARPELDEDAVRALGAQWFTAQHSDPARSGLALGLCDELMTEADTFAALVTHVSGTAVPGETAAIAAQSQPEKGDTMAGKMTAARRAKLEQQRANIQAQLDEADAMEDEPDAEGDEPDAEGDEPDAEGDEPDAEGDEPDAEGDEPDAEGDEPDAEGDDDETEMRVSHVLAWPEAKGLETTARRLARQRGPKLSLKAIRTELKAIGRTARLEARADHGVRQSGAPRGSGGLSADQKLVAQAKADAAARNSR